MHYSFSSRCTALILLSTTLAVFSVACSRDNQIAATGGSTKPAPQEESTATPVAIESPVPSPEPEPIQSPSKVDLDSFELGLDRAAGAFSISQSAQSSEDWKLVISLFQDAIALMEQVPTDSPYFSVAQTKIVEFQRQIESAQQKATRPDQPPAQSPPRRLIVSVPKTSVPPKTVLAQPLTIVKETQPLSLPTPSPVPLPPQEAYAAPIPQHNESSVVFVAPITRRMGGTPIIEVTFNGYQQFEMILDTGASGTVITQEMATILGVVPVGKAKANTASSKAVEFPIGYVNSMEAGGVKVNRVAVAIANMELDTGLLGHDFFGNYDITIKRHVVEFRPQSHPHISSPKIELTVPTSSKQPRIVEFP